MPRNLDLTKLQHLFAPSTIPTPETIRNHARHEFRREYAKKRFEGIASIEKSKTVIQNLSEAKGICENCAPPQKKCDKCLDGAKVWTCDICYAENVKSSAFCKNCQMHHTGKAFDEEGFKKNKKDAITCGSRKRFNPY